MKKILILALLMIAGVSVNAQVYTEDPDTVVVIIDDIDIDTTNFIDPDSVVQGNEVNVDSIAQGQVINEDTVYTVHTINQEQFKELVADYRVAEWKMRSPRPVIVDFYADWCQPCKRLEPMLRQIAQHYNGEVDFYRINVDENSDIADVFRIRSIPYLLICPLEGEPKSVIGVYPQQEFIRVFNQALGR